VALPISIRFVSGQGLTPKSTKVRFKGIDIGLVEKVKVLPDLTGVTAMVNDGSACKPGASGRHTVLAGISKG
jgi:paraquat-inducible protein B